MKMEGFNETALKELARRFPGIDSRRSPSESEVTLVSREFLKQHDEESMDHPTYVVLMRDEGRLPLVDWIDKVDGQLALGDDGDERRLERLLKCGRVGGVKEMLELLPRIEFSASRETPAIPEQALRRLEPSLRRWTNEEELTHLRNCPSCQEELFLSLSEALREWRLTNCPGPKDVAIWLGGPDDEFGRALCAHARECEPCRREIQEQAEHWKVAGWIEESALKRKLNQLKSWRERWDELAASTKQAYERLAEGMGDIFSPMPGLVLAGTETRGQDRDNRTAEPDSGANTIDVEEFAHCVQESGRVRLQWRDEFEVEVRCESEGLVLQLTPEPKGQSYLSFSYKTKPSGDAKPIEFEFHSGRACVPIKELEELASGIVEKAELQIHELGSSTTR